MITLHKNYFLQIWLKFLGKVRPRLGRTWKW